MPETRAQLLTRKGDLLAALRLLEQDYRDGVVDEEAYHTARVRYEQEAARVLEQIDSLPPEHGGASEPRGRPLPRITQRRPRWFIITVVGAILAAAIGIFLFTALHGRVGNGPLTVDAGQAPATPGPPPPPRLLAAEQAALAHPRSARAFVDLGNAYLSNGQAAAADQSYRHAMTLDPRDPQAATLHAMVIGYGGQGSQALTLLHQVEARHPAYSRAWLLDGMIAAHGPKGYRRAIAAWQRFLALDPRGPVSVQVRRLLGRLERLERTSRR